MTETLTIIELIDYIRHIEVAQSMRPDPINWGFVNSCVLTVTAAVLLCEPYRGDDGCEGLQDARMFFCSGCRPVEPVHTDCGSLLFDSVSAQLNAFIG